MSPFHPQRLFCFLVIAAAMIFCGCHVPNRMYRPGNSSVIQVPEPPALPARTPWPPHPEPQCDHTDLRQRPCLAFIEFDDFGETWEKSGSGRPAQLQAALRLINEAKDQDPQHQPLVLTFIHGWKHNASAGNKSGEDDLDIAGLESVLNQLHDREYAADKDHPQRVVIGIYIAWRGNLVSQYWPVRQNFTYWNREAGAIRVGNADLTDALIEISETARRPNCTPAPEALAQKPCTAFVLFIGHSFGALVLERALTQAMIHSLEKDWNDAHNKALASKAAVSPQPQILALADLVIYVNSAAAATESKQMMDYLASSHFTYQPGNVTDSPFGPNKPLFLSVTSESDMATGFTFKLGHGVSWIRYASSGSMRGNGTSDPEKPAYARVCFDPLQSTKSQIKTDLTQTNFYMSTTAHMSALWSHSVTRITNTSSGLQSLPDPSCTSSGTRSGTLATCHIAGNYYEIAPLPNRCNGTPYWVMQVDKDIIPDHGTIFTDRLIHFLIAFFPSRNDLSNTMLRPKLEKVE